MYEQAPHEEGLSPLHHGQSPAGDRYRTIVLALTIVIGAIVFSFRLISFLHAKEIAIYTGIIVLACLTFRRQIGLQGIYDFAPLWLWLLAATANAAFGTVQAPADAFSEILRWVLLLLAVATVYDLFPKPGVSAHLLTAIQFSALLVAVLGLLQYAGWASALFPEFPQYTQRVYSVFGNQDLFGGYLALALPLSVLRLDSAFATRRTAIANLAAFAVLLLALLLSASRSAWLAAAVGTLLAAHRNWKSGWRVRQAIVPAAISLLVLVAASLCAPEATVARLHHSLQPDDEGRNARIACWHAGWRLFTQSPLFGIGLGNFAYWSPGVLGDLAAQSGGAPNYAMENHADHPHSEPVRFLAETGAFGFLCLCWMVLQIARARAPETPALAAIAVFALFNGAFLSVAHLWPALLLAACALSRNTLPVPASRVLARMLPLLTAISAAGIAAVTIVPGYRLQHAMDAFAEGKPALGLLKAAAEAAPRHAETQKQYGIALTVTGHDDEARRHLLKALAGADTGDIYLALATVAARQTDYPAAERFARECLHRWPVNQDVKTLLADLANTTEK